MLLPDGVMQNATSISLSLPILVCGLLVFVAFVALVLVALRCKESVQAGLQLQPWSIKFSLNARNGRQEPDGAENESASNRRLSASKP